MAEKDAKKAEPKKAAPAESGVLASLPSTRTARLSRRARDGGAAAATQPKAAKSTPRKAPPKAPKAKPAKAGAPKVKPAKTGERKELASVTEATPQRPRPVRSASKNLAEPAQKAAGQRKPAADRGQSATELVTTVVQAAGELAQVGLSVGGHILKRAVEKLPKP